MNHLLEDPRFWRALLLILAPASFWFGFRCWKRARLIQDLPASRVRSVAQGYVELLGIARLTSGTAMVSPLTHRPCVWWTYRIQQRRRSGRDTRWATVDRDTSCTPFLLEDDGAWCVINPLGAEVFPDDKRTWYGSAGWPTDAPALSSRSWLAGTMSEYRYIEHTIGEQVMVNAMGEFRTVGRAEAHEREGAVARLLAEWKHDMPALMARFDANHDGVLSQQEWETARAAARRQIEAQALRAPSTEYGVLQQPADHRPFLLAAGNLTRLGNRYRWQAAGALLAFVMLCGLLATLLLD